MSGSRPKNKNTKSHSVTNVRVGEEKCTEMVKSMDESVFKSLLDSAVQKIDFKDGRTRVKMAGSGEGDDSKNTVILNYILDELDAEDAKNDDPDSMLSKHVYSPRRAKYATAHEAAYLGDRTASSSPPPTRRQPIDKRNKGDSEKTKEKSLGHHGSEFGKFQAHPIDVDHISKTGQMDENVSGKPVKFDNDNFEYIDDGNTCADVEMTDLSSDAWTPKVASDPVSKYGEMHGLPPPSRNYRCGNPTETAIEYTEYTNADYDAMEQGLPICSLSSENRGFSLLRDVNHHIHMEPKITGPEEHFLIRDVNNEIMNANETILGPQCNGMFSNLSYSVEGTDEKPANQTFPVRPYGNVAVGGIKNVYTSEASQEYSRYYPSGGNSCNFSRGQQQNNNLFNSSVHKSIGNSNNSYVSATVAPAPETQRGQQLPGLTASQGKNQELFFPSKQDIQIQAKNSIQPVIERDNSAMSDNDVEKLKLKQMKERKNKRKKESYTKGSDLGCMGERPLEEIIADIEGVDSVTTENKKGKKKEKAGRRKSKESPVSAVNEQQVAIFATEKTAETIGALFHETTSHNKQSEQQPQSVADSGAVAGSEQDIKTGAQQGKTSAAAEAAGEIVAPNTGAGQHKVEKQSPRRKKNGKGGQGSQTGITSDSTCTVSTNRPSNEDGEEEFLSADEGQQSPNPSTNRYELVKGGKKQTALENQTPAPDSAHSTLNTSAASEILLDAANYRADSEDAEQIERQFNRHNEDEEFITVQHSHKKKNRERRTGSAGASNRNSTTSKASSAENTAPSASDTGRRSSFGVQRGSISASVNGGTGNYSVSESGAPSLRHYKRPTPTGAHLGDYLDGPTKAELAKAAKTHPPQPTNSHHSGSERSATTTSDHLEINTEEDMPYLSGGPPSLNGSSHSPDAQPPKFSYANVVKKSADPSRECSPNSTAGAQVSSASSTSSQASVSPSPPPSAIQQQQPPAPPPHAKQIDEAKQQQPLAYAQAAAKHVVNTPVSHHHNKVALLSDVVNDAPETMFGVEMIDPQTDKTTSVSTSSGGFSFHFDESVAAAAQAAAAASVASPCISTQNYQDEDMTIGCSGDVQEEDDSKVIELVTGDGCKIRFGASCGTQVGGAQRDALGRQPQQQLSAAMLDIVRIMNERWNAFVESKPEPIVYQCVSSQTLQS